MAYGDYSGPDKPNKGHEGGACNRQRCQAEPAVWYNHGGSHSWYCVDCRNQIQFDSINLRDWERNFHPRLERPMFETREMINNRELHNYVLKYGLMSKEELFSKTQPAGEGS